MKTTRVLKPIKFAILIIYSSQIFAQSTDAVPDANAAVQSSAAQIKADKAANRALAKQIRRTLSRSMGSDADNISVRALSGAVTLGGFVTDQEKSGRAAQITSGIAGVTTVTNALVIRRLGM
jgi:hyperosmotically inducible periplasmic protein